LIKHFIIKNLHGLFGFDNYLFIFTIFKINTLSLDKRKKEYVFFSKMFPDKSNVIVIGANTGITTVPVAKNIPGGKVFAIEPVPENFKTLNRVIKFFKLKNIFPENVALGNENKIISMIMPVINDVKSHGLAHIKEESIEDHENGINYTVPMKRLDDLFVNSNEKIHGIKIVAENYEKFIFEGGKETILKHKPLIYCELWLNENRLKTLELIQSWDYDVKVLDNKNLIPYDPVIHTTKNLFFIPKNLK